MKTHTLILISLLLPSLAFSLGYEYSSDAPRQGGNSTNKLESIYLHHDHDSNTLDMSFKWDGSVEGMWIGVNGGPNPKGQDLGIMYINWNDNGRVKGSVYTYAGSKSFMSDVIAGKRRFNKSLQSSSVVKSNTETSVSVSLDLDRLGKQYGKFVAGFGDHMGYWLHWFDNLKADYSGKKIASWEGSGKGWSDTAWNDTVETPEPASMLLLGAGLLAAQRKRLKLA